MTPHFSKRGLLSNNSQYLSLLYMHLRTYYSFEYLARKNILHCIKICWIMCQDFSHDSILFKDNKLFAFHDLTYASHMIQKLKATLAPVLVLKNIQLIRDCSFNPTVFVYQKLNTYFERSHFFCNRCSVKSTFQQWLTIVCWLLNVPTTCECISGKDLLRQLYVLPHWEVADQTSHLTQSQFGFFFVFVFFAFPSYISGVHHFGWDFCVCDRFLI